MIFVLALLVLIAAYPFAVEWRRKPMNGLARQDAPGQFVELSRGTTHYQWHGPLRGPVAVCVHGLTTPSFVWLGLAEGLAALGYRVLTYDLYGRGYSDRPKGLQDEAFFVGQLEELLKSQELYDDLTVIGYSMGGAISTGFAAKHPGMIRHLVLLAPAGMVSITDRMTKFICKTPVLGDWLMLMFFPQRHQKGTEAERDLPSSVPDIVDLQQNEMTFRGFFPGVLSSLRGILSHTMEEEHRTIHRESVPVLAIWGRLDDVIPLSAMGKLAEWSRSAHQDVIEDAGHGLPYTHSVEVLKILRERMREGLN